MSRRPRRSTLFPYTTLFRSVREARYDGELCRRARVRRVSRRGNPALGGGGEAFRRPARLSWREPDRKSTRLNSSHEWISYAVFCLKKKNGPSETERLDEEPG